MCVAPLLRNSNIESTYTQTLSLDGDVEKKQEQLNTYNPRNPLTKRKAVQLRASQKTDTVISH